MKKERKNSKVNKTAKGLRETFWSVSDMKRTTGEERQRHSDKILEIGTGCTNAMAMQYATPAQKQRHCDLVLQIGSGHDNAVAMQFATLKQRQILSNRVLEIGDGSANLVATQFVSPKQESEHRARRETLGLK